MESHKVWPLPAIIVFSRFLHIAAHIGTSLPCLSARRPFLAFVGTAPGFYFGHSPSTLSSLGLPHPQHQGWGHDLA